MGMSRRFWDMPLFFKNVNITYHSNPWKRGCFMSAGRGQEFVMDSNPEIMEWVKKLVL